MPRSRNYRFADDLTVGTPQAGAESLVSPSSTSKATTDAVVDVMKNPSKAIEGIIEQGRQIASNKQKLISTIIKPMKGLDDKPASSGSISPAEAYVNQLLLDIEAISSIPEDAAIAMILEVWPVWQNNGNTWDTFIEFISYASSIFSNPQEVIAWSKKLFESMQDGAPVFTPEYIMSVALEAIRTRNFTNYQNLLISLPFYKSIWSKQPIDASGFSKAVSQISTLMEAVRTPTEDMKVALQNMVEKNRLITSMSTFYKSMIRWVTEASTRKMIDAANLIRNKNFQTGSTFELLIEIEMQKKALHDTIGDAIRGLNVVNPEPMKKTNSNKFFKTVLAAPAGGSSGSGSSGSSSGSGSSGSSSGSGSSGSLSPAEQAARKDANKINRLVILVEKRKLIIENNVSQINNITEQKTKGLSGDLGLFSSLVTSGNVVKKIDETLKVMQTQFFEIDTIINLSKAWLTKHSPAPGQDADDAREGMSDTIRANEMTYQAQKLSLNELSQSLKIQKIVLPKELEYFELKQEYDTNVEQLKAPVSALMVNSLQTTTDSNTGKTKTINTRVTRPLAIKNAWETGKKIVTLLMQISQALQAGTGRGSMGESMAKNAASYYKAAIKQEVDNNKMLMDNLTNVGLGQVNNTPVAVGKK